MEYIEKTGKTVEEAIDSALTELKITADRADITVVDQGKPGFLGIGSKPAKVRVSVKNDTFTLADNLKKAATEGKSSLVREDEILESGDIEGVINEKSKEEKIVDIKEETIVTAKEFLQAILQKMKLEAVIEKFVNVRESTVTFKLHGDDMGILIGKHGMTLDSLQYLTSLVANRVNDEKIRVHLDVEDYRDRRAETLTRLARRLADKVRREGESIALEPMNPHERKVIHLALQNDRRITTCSEGEGSDRHVVIQLKK